MPLQLKTTDEIFSEIRQANPFYQAIAGEGFWGKELFRENFPSASGKGKFVPLTIELATCNEEKQTVLASETYIRSKIKNKLVV